MLALEEVKGLLGVKGSAEDTLLLHLIEAATCFMEDYCQIIIERPAPVVELAEAALKHQARLARMGMAPVVELPDYEKGGWVKPTLVRMVAEDYARWDKQHVSSFRGGDFTYAYLEGYSVQVMAILNKHKVSRKLKTL